MYTPSPFYTVSVVLFQLDECVVSHMQILTTPLLREQNIKYSYCWIITSESINSCLFLRQSCRDVASVDRHPDSTKYYFRHKRNIT